MLPMSKSISPLELRVLPWHHRTAFGRADGKVRAIQVVALLALIVALGWIILVVVNFLVAPAGAGGAQLTDKALFKTIFPDQFNGLQKQHEKKRSRR